jgi:hypothetical protein
MTVTLAVKEWVIVADCLEMAQREMLDTLKTATQPIGAGLAGLIERDAGKACDVKESLRARIQQGGQG